MVFIVALYVPWCGYLESLPNVRPQIYANVLKCSAQCPHALLVLLGSLLGMSGLLVRMCRLGNVQG